MSDIIYNREEVGTELKNKRGKNILVRKYHLSNKEIEINRNRWNKEISTVPTALKKKAGTEFFNPYRQGIYYYQVQSLFLLGSNEWHSLAVILQKIEEYMSNIKINSYRENVYGYKNAWDQFVGKSGRDSSSRCKDYVGRVQENFILLQRLSKLHPYGYKLNQACGAIDIKRVDVKGFSSGLYFYRLSTYDSPNKALPIRDFSEFNFPKSKNKYVNDRFIGVIVTKDKIIQDGKVVVSLSI